MTKGLSRRALLATLPASAALSTLGLPAFGQTLAGQRLEAFIPSNPGGANDLYMRFVAQRLQPHLPGSPTINVVNMIGGGGVVAANHFASLPANGLATICASTGMFMAYALNRNDPKVRYNPADWVPYLCSPANYVTYIKKPAGLEGIEAVKARLSDEFVLGMGGPVTANFLSFFSLHLLGARMRPIFGIGGGENLLAFERGEFSLMIESMGEYLQVAATKDDILPVFSLGVADADGGIVRDPLAPDVPTFQEVYEAVHGTPFSGPEADLWQKLFTVTNTASKILAVARGTPEAILEEYHAGVESMISDPGWKAAAGPVIGDYQQWTRDDAAEWLTRVTEISEEDAAWLRAWYAENYGITEL